MRQTKDYKDFQREGRKAEKRLALAILRAFDKAQEIVSINSLAVMIANKKPGDVIPDVFLEDVLIPASNIVSDTFVKGGKVGAKLVNQMNEEIESRNE